MELKVLSIDIGISNLGFVYSLICLEREYTNVYKRKIGFCYSEISKNRFIKNSSVLDCGRIDITHIKHNAVSLCDCTLRHENCIPDYLDHFIQENQKMFDECDVILLERQPPMGIMNVQDLLFVKFRHKVIMVSPNQVHKYFNLSTDYSERKKESERIATRYLEHFNSFTHSIRKHDITDAMCMIIFWSHLRNDEYQKTNQVVQNPSYLNLDHFKLQNISLP